ncbi:nucleotide pyrophosphatase/phosphodiesterase family protein [Aureibacter tunicatorum]|uniref:AlkP superfamily pyrophosphatase or phosphodiesterase n=1 Tax=Aureibacter tunicatorum TaxID=866807 RepID=A0AAE4BTA6_9BACT|nr:alkaline phosphatase family protein [Aureibacter tunicatorum]MDR6240596.1 putative AlkP superfamily pyrophosphatase or phosphodiesterase [Aureibacter tunicatorum]BDD06543.1 alkaline phosphatase family protein [Aureibacter tunicatorum]
MNRVALINVVGLTQKILENEKLFLSKWAKSKAINTIVPVIPAVTCSAQSTYLTGLWPSQHGIVGNGWYNKEQSEVQFWKQSNALVQGEKIWETAKKINASFTCANTFWWYNMYSSVDYAITPRPQYRADGRKIPDCHSSPSELRDTLQEKLGVFPLFDFWGPNTSIKSSQWIAEASKIIENEFEPTLQLVYIPHLDYCMQKNEFDSPCVQNDIQDLDILLKELIQYFENRNVEPILISEYGIVPVDSPIHINRILRKKGFLSIRKEGQKEYLDAGASKAFAVSDHQIAHIYIKDSSLINSIKSELENIHGIMRVLDRKEQSKYRLDHSRSGDLVLLAEENHWFTYYFWENNQYAPDYAKTVDIHRKPGYDPIEMFFDQNQQFLKAKIGIKLLKKKIGMRTLMDFIPLDASLAKGSHGIAPTSDKDKPVLISNEKFQSLKAIDIKNIILKNIFDEKISTKCEVVETCDTLQV